MQKAADASLAEVSKQLKNLQQTDTVGEMCPARKSARQTCKPCLTSDESTYLHGI